MWTHLNLSDGSVARMGDRIRVLMRPDGASFHGRLAGFNNDYILLQPQPDTGALGFPCDSIIEVELC